MISALKSTLKLNNLKILRPKVTKNLTNFCKKFCKSPPPWLLSFFFRIRKIFSECWARSNNRSHFRHDLSTSSWNHQLCLREDETNCRFQDMGKNWELKFPTFLSALMSKMKFGLLTPPPPPPPPKACRP